MACPQHPERVQAGRNGEPELPRHSRRRRTHPLRRLRRGRLQPRTGFDLTRSNGRPAVGHHRGLRWNGSSPPPVSPPIASAARARSDGSFRATEDGTVIDSPISSVNLANGAYPDDLIGYEFTAPPVYSTPTITGLSPSSGDAGASIAITGTNLIDATAVHFAGVEAGGYEVRSPTQITAVVPASATTGPISVTTPGGTATSAGTSRSSRRTVVRKSLRSLRRKARPLVAPRSRSRAPISYPVQPSRSVARPATRRSARRRNSPRSPPPERSAMTKWWSATKTAARRAGRSSPT